jgi:uncharacterized membrane protein YhaH (DUF805 family)
MSHLPTSVLQVFDPRGRCNRKGLLVSAAILLALQVVIALALWGAGIDLASPLLLPLDVAFCWVAFALISKRLHDLGRSAWWIPAVVLIWLVAITCLAGAIVLSGDPDLLAPGTTGYWITFAIMLLPLLAAAIWLHATPGNQGSNRFGPEPTSHGFSMPADVASYWQRSPTAGRA